MVGQNRPPLMLQSTSEKCVFRIGSLPLLHVQTYHTAEKYFVFCYEVV
jgi:hypothetical protein